MPTMLPPVPNIIPDRAGLRICLAGSGGGHVRQLLDLEPAWKGQDHFFITEDTALGQSLSREHRTYFVPHYAWGQAKFGAPFKMVFRALVSFLRCALIMWRERPDVVVTTGAGAVFFSVLWGRVLGARIVVIESFARFEAPSLFGRIAAPLAHHMIVQSNKLAHFYPKAKVFDPLRILETTPRPKQGLLFATVGATLPFDRLVDMVEALEKEGAFSERIVIQTGVGGRRPEGIETYETLPFSEIARLLQDSSVVVCHGGTGSIITALREGCHVIAIPRLHALGEHYDDHQLEIATAFEKRGLIRTVRTLQEFRSAMHGARTSPRVTATTDPQQLIAFLADMFSAREASKAGSQTDPTSVET